MTKVKQILQWHSEGVGKKKIALRAGVNRNTVKSYIRQFISMNRPVEELLAMPDKELEEQFAARPVYEPDERLKALTPAGSCARLDKYPRSTIMHICA